jgi:alpha-1,6-mannosyltransferase
MVAGYGILAVIAGAPNSPLATPLPVGARPPRWAADLARVLGVDRAGRSVLIAVSLLIVAALVAAFVFLLVEAWSNRVRLSSVLVAAGASLTISVAAPVLLSRDVFSYAAYARIYGVDHLNPYGSVPAAFPRDPFVAVTAAQWIHVHPLYGPVFTLVSGAIVRAWPRSPGAVIFAFKALAGTSIAIATACAALAARALRAERAALTAAVVGLNPVLVVHTVGGGHNDALIAAALSGALALAVTEPRRRAPEQDRRPLTLKTVAVTALLTLAVLIKAVVAPVLVLWLWSAARWAPPRHRMRTMAVHAATVTGLSVAVFTPIMAGRYTLVPLGTFGGVESWASPARLVGRGARALVNWLGGPAAGTAAERAVVGSFLLMFMALLWRLRPRRAGSAHGAAVRWGSALLLLALAMPYLLPWYAAWFAPFLGLMQDDALLWIGVAVTGLLALTLVPADPFHGLSTGGVILGVHYLVAPVMLVLFIAAARRVLRLTTGEPLKVNDPLQPARGEEDQVSGN